MTVINFAEPKNVVRRALDMMNEETWGQGFYSDYGTEGSYKVTQACAVGFLAMAAKGIPMHVSLKNDEMKAQVELLGTSSISEELREFITPYFKQVYDEVTARAWSIFFTEEKKTELLNYANGYRNAFDDNLKNKFKTEIAQWACTQFSNFYDLTVDDDFNVTPEWTFDGIEDFNDNYHTTYLDVRRAFELAANAIKEAKA